jgi:nucleoside triphosphate pyrophosphatase
MQPDSFGVGLTLVLASTSPRRYQILSLLQVSFLMMPPRIIEQISEQRSPAEEAGYQARQKAASRAAEFPDAILIGSDTLIALDQRKIGKPVDAADARATLERLGGRPHDIITAVCLVESASGKSFEWIETVRVTMRPYSDAEILIYIATGEGWDKAGSYSLQGTGRTLLAGLKGDYLAAVGLPLRAVAEGLQKMGVRLGAEIDDVYRQRDFLNWRSFD